MNVDFKLIYLIQLDIVFKSMQCEEIRFTPATGRAHTYIFLMLISVKETFTTLYMASENNLFVPENDSCIWSQVLHFFTQAKPRFQTVNVLYFSVCLDLFNLRSWGGNWLLEACCQCSTIFFLWFCREVPCSFILWIQLLQRCLLIGAVIRMNTS